MEVAPEEEESWFEEIKEKPIFYFTIQTEKTNLSFMP